MFQYFNINMLKALVQTVTPFEQNASILFCSETNKCAIVDPGGDIHILLELLKNHNLVPERVLLTHGHIDHAGGATEISEILNVEIHGPHIDDKFLLDELQKQGESLSSGFFLQVGSFKTLERANLLKNNLSKKGYLAFVVAVRISKESEIWHRVVIGKFAEKEFAVKAAIELKETENLNSVIKWQEGSIHKVFHH